MYLQKHRAHTVQHELHKAEIEPIAFTQVGTKNEFEHNLKKKDVSDPISIVMRLTKP